MRKHLSRRPALLLRPPMWSVSAKKLLARYLLAVHGISGASVCPCRSIPHTRGLRRPQRGPGQVQNSSRCFSSYRKHPRELHECRLHAGYRGNQHPAQGLSHASRAARVPQPPMHGTSICSVKALAIHECIRVSASQWMNAHCLEGPWRLAALIFLYVQERVPFRPSS